MEAFGSLGRGPGGAGIQHKRCGVESEQKELERGAGKVLRAEDTQLGDTLH